MSSSESNHMMFWNSTSPGRSSRSSWLPREPATYAAAAAARTS